MGPPSVKPVLVEVGRRLHDAGPVVRPGVGVERVVLQGPEAVAAELLAAALGDQAQQARRRTPVLRLVVGGQDLHLLHRVGVLHAHGEAAVGADANRRGAVNRGHELLGAPAVDGGDAGRERERPAGQSSQVAADGAGHQLRHLCGAARAERRVGDLLGAHGAADHPRVDERRRRLDLHGLREPADLELDIDADVQAGVDAHAGSRHRLEAGKGGVDPIVADGNVRERIQPRVVRHRAPFEAGAFGDEDDVHAREHAAGAVLNRARDLRGVELRQGRRREEQNCEADERESRESCRRT